MPVREPRRAFRDGKRRRNRDGRDNESIHGFLILPRCAREVDAAILPRRVVS
jgi:hypothetical protein